jgi:hypothetical protein
MAIELVAASEIRGDLERSAALFACPIFDDAVQMEALKY